MNQKLDDSLNSAIRILYLSHLVEVYDCLHWFYEVNAPFSESLYISWIHRESKRYYHSIPLLVMMKFNLFTFNCFSLDQLHFILDCTTITTCRRGEDKWSISC